MLIHVAGSNPALSRYTLVIGLILQQLSEATIKACVANLIGTLKDQNDRKWLGMNFIFVSIALCATCRELTQR